MSSTEPTTPGPSSTRGGRSSAGARGGKGRGRGRGGFRFPAPPSTDVEGTRLPPAPADAESQSSQPGNAESKRKPPRKANARRSFTSVSSSGPTADTESIPKQSLEKELPPHIAGAAVDAESLVSRVRELAIHAHAHTSSVESRFTMSRNWADEEDDPDSLPDLDDWALKPKPEDGNNSQRESVAIENTPLKQLSSGRDVILSDGGTSTSTNAKPDLPSQNRASPSLEPVSVESLDNDSRARAEYPSATASASDRPNQKEIPSLPESENKPSRNEEKGSLVSSPTTNREGPRSKNLRQANNRGRHSRIADLPFHPLNLSRSSPAKETSSQSPSNSRKPAEDKQNPRKHHTRPVISSDALARISRSLGRGGIQPQPTTTTATT